MMAAGQDYRKSPYLDGEIDDLVDYLHRLYVGVFTEESIRVHLVNHVGYAFADYTRGILAQRLQPGARVLDIGCGFGSTVIAAREAGFQAFGLEIAPFEVAFARRRLARVRPGDAPDSVFILGDATRLALADNSVDAVAFWNVLEHIEHCDAMLEAAWRFLRPGGIALIVCPNYAADRLEAHYHVPWRADLRHDRHKAADYLRSLGRDPRYFETSIFCRTNREILEILRRIGFEPQDIGTGQSMALRLRNLPAMLRRPGRFVEFHKPTRDSIILSARKPAGS